MNRRNVLVAIATVLVAACGGTSSGSPGTPVTGTVFEDRLAALATRAGVTDLPAWQACRNDASSTQVVASDVALGASLGVRGTPTFFVNGTAIVGAQPAATFRDAIDAARTQAMASGVPATDYYATAAPLVPVGDSPVRGPSDAWVTIVAFSDFECPYCARAEATLDGVLPGYGSDVRYVFKNFPLTSLHAFAQPTAIAALCAGRQGRFWPFHDLVFADPDGLFYGP